MGIYPNLTETDDIASKCSKCIVAGLPCADTHFNTSELWTYTKNEDGFCEETKGNYYLILLYFQMY